MCNNIKFPAIIALFLIANFVSGQIKKYNNSIDTLIIYETVTVYDTIFVYDTLKIFENEKLIKIEPKGMELNILQNDSKNQRINLLIISQNQTATIPIDSIIYNGNIKNIKIMKKLSFIGLISLTFKTLMLAQTDYGISIGGGVWWARCNNTFVKGEKIAKINTSPNFTVGLFYKQYFNTKITLETQINYQLLLSNYSYKSFYPSLNTCNPDLTCYYMLWDNLSFPEKVLIDDGRKIYTSRIVGEEESTINYHKIIIPVQIGYIFYKFNPYIGLKYSLKMYNLSETKIIADNNERVIEWEVGEKNGFNKFKKEFGFTVGLNFFVTNRLKVNLNYYHAITKDYNYTGYLLDCKTNEIVSKENYFWKTRNFELSLLYSLRKKGKIV